MSKPQSAADVATCIRKDRFCDGPLGDYAKNGFLDRCSMRLEFFDGA